MLSASIALALLLSATAWMAVGAYSTPPPPSSTQSRRLFFSNIWKTAAVGTVLTTTTMTTGPETALASSPTTEAVYFGVGCFWHIQHELVAAERSLLGRNDHELTSATGYAGGKSNGPRGQVCYHNLRGVADYGKLGHGEVVGLALPTDSIVTFSEVYFSLFNQRTKGAYV
jgi:hypothetical protein